MVTDTGDQVYLSRSKDVFFISWKGHVIEVMITQLRGMTVKSCRCRACKFTAYQVLSQGNILAETSIDDEHRDVLSKGVDWIQLQIGAES